jgi:hypothetical protein
VRKKSRDLSFKRFHLRHERGYEGGFVRGSGAEGVEHCSRFGTDTAEGFDAVGGLEFCKRACGQRIEVAGGGCCEVALALENCPRGGAAIGVRTPLLAASARGLPPTSCRRRGPHVCRFARRMSTSWRMPVEFLDKPCGNT